MGRPSGFAGGFAEAKDDVDGAAPGADSDFWQATEKAASSSAPASDANLFLFTISIFSWSLTAES